MERYQFDEATRKTLEKLRVPLAVYQFLNQRVVTVLLSDGFCKLLGTDDRQKAMDLMNNDMYEATHPDDKARIADEAVLFATMGGRYDVVYRTRIFGSGEYRILHAIGEHVYTEDGVRLAYVWYTDEGPYSAASNDRLFSVNNPLRRILRETSAVNAVSYDALTGLPSMSYFFEIVNRRRRDNKGVGGASILYMNLCGMKNYNRRFGFAEGDNLLKRFAKILIEHFGIDSCSRFGSDHFCVYTKEKDIEGIINTIFSDFGPDKGEPSLPVHVGVYSEIEGVFSVSAECDRAKYACDILRSRRFSCFQFYENTMLVQEVQHHYFVDDLDKAIAENRIIVYYQPLIRSANGRVCDEEALVRWADPVKGLIPPSEFIPALEEAKLIYKLDLCVLEQVLKKIKAQQEEKLYVVPHSINFSRIDFDVCDIVEEIRQRVDAAGVRHDLINIEVTESTVGKDFDYMKAQIERFRNLGFHVWMDDFGNGYSALDVLQDIHFDLIKFDMRFMRQFDEGDKSKIMLTELLRMAISLGIDTVCEGVETEEQANFLREVGCTMMQGYYFCRPIPMETIFERYRKGIQIGFENPDESDYYSAIGRVNLYDLAILSNEDPDGVEHYFNTIPMGIIETTADYFMLIRCNSSYRAFLTKLIGTLPIGKKVSYAEGDGITSSSFLSAMRECAEKGSKMIIDDKLPDGSIMHTLLKCIAVNPVSGVRALAVAVLAITPPEKEPVTFTYVARALSSDYISLYYVNLKTERFVEYSSDTEQGELATERYGEDFFWASHRDARLALYHEDLDEFLNAFNKENILRSIEEKGSFKMSYRLMINGVPSDVTLKAVRVKTDEDHMIIGLTKKEEHADIGGVSKRADSDGGKRQ